MSEGRCGKEIRPFLTATRLLGSFPFHPSSSYSFSSLFVSFLLALPLLYLFSSPPSVSWRLRESLETLHTRVNLSVPPVFLACYLRRGKFIFRAVRELDATDRLLAGDFRYRLARVYGLSVLCFLQFALLLLPFLPYSGFSLEGILTVTAVFHCGLCQLCFVALLAGLCRLVVVQLGEVRRRLDSPVTPTLVRVVARLWEVSRLLDTAFRIQTLWIIFLVFSAYFVHAHSFIGALGSPGDVVRFLVFCTVFANGLSLFLQLVLSCSRVARKGEEVLEGFYRAAQLWPRLESQAKVKLLLRAKPRIAFSACHLFPVDNTLLHSVNIPDLSGSYIRKKVASAIIVYAVVMLQLKDA